MTENLDLSISNYLSKKIIIDEELLLAAKLTILDTFGCIIEASSHQEVINFAFQSKEVGEGSNPFELVKEIQDPKDISFALTVLTRWFDYNDTFLAKEWAHPSDNFGSVFSYFVSNQHLLFEDFITSLVQTYEIQGSLCLGTSLNKEGYDHVFYVKLASGAVYSHLINDGNKEIVRRTINNILLDGPSLRSYRHFPNVGKRKSWAAADASKRGMELAQFSKFDDEIYETIQTTENWGFENVYMDDQRMVFGKELDSWVLKNILFKVLFPAEFHGQSAVEAAIKLSSEFNEKIKSVKQINIYTHEPAVRIISNKTVLKNASDRDHSLEYMVAAALLFGDLTYEMYEDDFGGIDKIEELRKNIFVQEDKTFTENYYEFSKRDISNSVEIQYSDDSKSKLETVINPIGHPTRREEAVPLLKNKFTKNLSKLFSTEKAEFIWDGVMSLSNKDEVSKLLKLFHND